MWRLRRISKGMSGFWRGFSGERFGGSWGGDGREGWRELRLSASVFRFLVKASSRQRRRDLLLYFGSTTDCSPPNLPGFVRETTEAVV